MSGNLKKMTWWVRRRSNIPMLIIASVIVLVLFFNEDTSVELNVQYQSQINDLKKGIKLNLDSAAYYKKQRMAIERSDNGLEHIAREQYHMQRPTEDVYIIR